jgi:DNA polymerase-1
MKRLVLIDGHALLHRAFHAIPSLTTSKGELVNAVFGFTNMLLKVISDLEPSHLAVAFDRPVPTFRHKEYPDYQAQRPPLPEEFKNQHERLREVLKVLEIPIYEKDGYEADDVIGTLANKARVHEVVVVTGDRDMMQLITDRIKIYAPKKGLSEPEMYDERKFEEKYNLRPSQVVDFKALVGDPSDNYPGVAGVGPKTATSLLQKYGSLREIYKHLHELPQKTTQNLKKGKDRAKLSQKLAQIVINAPVELDLKKCKVGRFNRKEVVDLFKELEFKSLIKRLPGVEKPEEEQMKLI